MTVTGIAEEFYARLEANDVDGAAALFPEGALLAIPGATSISGDHRGGDIHRVLEKIVAAQKAGRVRTERICTYDGKTGVIFLFDNFVGTEQYHSAHEWIARDGKLVAFMIYIHEYDLFAKTWS